MCLLLLTTLIYDFLSPLLRRWIFFYKSGILSRKEQQNIGNLPLFNYFLLKILIFFIHYQFILKRIFTPLLHSRPRHTQVLEQIIFEQKRPRSFIDSNSPIWKQTKENRILFPGWVIDGVNNKQVSFHHSLSLFPFSFFYIFPFFLLVIGLNILQWISEE